LASTISIRRRLNHHINRLAVRETNRPVIPRLHFPRDVVHLVESGLALVVVKGAFMHREMNPKASSNLAEDNLLIVLSSNDVSRTAA